MTVRAEPHHWTLRYYSQFNPQYGDPYQWVASMKLVRPGEVEIFGIDKPITREIHHAVVAELRRLEIQRYMIARYTEGQRREVWRKVR